MSLCLASGHPDAWHYPIGMLFDEARLVVVRQNALQASEATLFQAAASSLFSSKGGQHFKRLVEDLTEG